MFKQEHTQKMYWLTNLYKLCQNEMTSSLEISHFVL